MIELDIRGKVCPDATSDVFPILRHLPDDETVLVTSDYPPARQTIPALARQFDCQAEVRDEEGGRFSVVIRKLAADEPV